MDLQALAELRQTGALSEDEFKGAKAQLLGKARDSPVTTPANPRAREMRPAVEVEHDPEVTIRQRGCLSRFDHQDIFILEGKPEGWSCLFGRCGGFSSSLEHQSWFEVVPIKLAERGVSQEEWHDWMRSLKGVQERARDCDPCRALHCLLCYPWIIPNPVWIAANLFCPWSQWDPFQRNLHKWLREVNDSLESRGMYVKGMSFGKATTHGDKWDDGSLPVLMFALTGEQSSRLKREAILQEGNSGDPNWACWCCLSHRGRAI